VNGAQSLAFNLTALKGRLPFATRIFVNNNKPSKMLESYIAKGTENFTVIG
jgi:hypothetical protein